MIIELLFTNPVIFFAWVVALLIAITVHEFAHATMAYYLGDPTAKYTKRLTLNPLAHLDLWGTLLLLFVGFGWGKPVPFNPYNLRNKRYGPALISIAGPMANLAIIVIFGLILRFIYPLTGLGAGNALYTLLSVIIALNAILMVFNLIPIPPLDGSKLLFAILPSSLDHIKAVIEQYGFFILIALLLFAGSVFSYLFVLIIRAVELVFGIELII